MVDTPNITLPLIEASQAQKHVTHNEAIRDLDALVHLSVLDRDLTAPPGSPADGQRWLIAAGATGLWAGKDGQVAAWQDGAWAFHAPKEGWICWIADEDIALAYDGLAWGSIGGGSTNLNPADGGLVGVNATADTTNRLSVTTPAVLFNNETGSIQTKLNKAAVGDTASFLFQTGFSGRAEFGLTGDDDFHVKFSSDGSAWNEAIQIDKDTGEVVFPSGTAPAYGHFSKADYDSVAFTKTGAGTIDLKAGTRIELAGVIYSFASATAVQMPSLSAGTDYAIYVCNDGTVRADASFTAPSGFTTSTSRKIGGFHYAPGGNAAAQAGGDSTPAINEYSLWDIKWSPTCPDPRGMALVDERFWCDIYVLGVDHYINGTSKYNVTIADGSSPPKVAAGFGGDGTATYSNLTWWTANECIQSAGKDLLSYGEYSAAAYGATEATSIGADPVTTKLDAVRTSRWGIMQATGNMYIWSRDFSTRGSDTAWAWYANTAGRGSLYLQNSAGLVAALLGGPWSTGSNAGSRTSYWDNYPWDSNNSIGARGRCDHLRLV